MDHYDRDAAERLGFGIVALILVVLTALSLLFFVLAGLRLGERSARTAAHIELPITSPSRLAPTPVPAPQSQSSALSRL